VIVSDNKNNGNTSRLLQLLAPYIAVGIFWCGFSNAWLAILAYHLQVLFWARHENRQIKRLKNKRFMLLALPTLVAGPVIYFLLPYITKIEISAWLTEYRLSGSALLLMIPYFGIVHPVIEQVHWAKLREQTNAAHLMFAGYHLLVLHSLLTFPWLLLCFVVLVSASFFWKEITIRSGSLLPATVSHILADLGVIIAVWLVQ